MVSFSGGSYGAHSLKRAEQIGVILFAGTGDGSTVLVSGACQGTELDISEARSWVKVTTDEDGKASDLRWSSWRRSCVHAHGQLFQ